MALQVQELLIHAARDSPHEQLGIESQRTGQSRHIVDGRGQFLRVCPDAVYRCADRKRLAVAVGDGAPVRGDPFPPKVARIGLLVQKLLVEHLQVNRPRRERDRDQREEHH